MAQKLDSHHKPWQQELEAESSDLNNQHKAEWGDKEVPWNL